MYKYLDWIRNSWFFSKLLLGLWFWVVLYFIEGVLLREKIEWFYVLSYSMLTIYYKKLVIYILIGK